jgi:3-oxoacyl-(acyl-carrier-protein) synthase
VISVTRLGAITALGDARRTFARVCAGEHGFGARPAWALDTPVACVQGVGHERNRTLDLAMRALGGERFDPQDLAVVVATTTAAMLDGEDAIASWVRGETPERPEDFFWNNLPHQPAVGLAAALGATGPSMVVSTACTSGTIAIGVAHDLLRAKRCRRALVIGTDGLCRTTVFGFRSLGAYTRDRPRPFDRNRDGLGIGEGAAYLLLEEGRGIAEVVGVANTTDGRNLTAPDPDGAGLVRAVRSALGGLDADHVNAHATGTDLNDGAEARGLANACPNAMVSATKGATGHTLGAAGVLEAVLLLLSMESDVVPGVCGLSDAVPDVDVSPGTRRREQRVGVSVNLAFGGHNAAVAFRR